MFGRRGSRCCCCRTIGYETGSWKGLAQCCSKTNKSYKEITSLAADVSRINKCRAVFCGLFVECFGGLEFSPGDWSTIADWVSGGGRLYVAGEYDGCITGFSKTMINSFLDAIGTTIRLGSGIYKCFCPGFIAGDGDAALGISVNARFSCTAEVTGGTSVVKTDGPTPVTFCAIEAVGDGFVMVSGDSNLAEFESAECGEAWEQSCELWTRFIEWKSEDLI